jgi:hypothetical protein
MEAKVKVSTHIDDEQLSGAEEPHHCLIDVCEVFPVFDGVVGCEQGGSEEQDLAYIRPCHCRLTSC